MNAQEAKAISKQKNLDEYNSQYAKILKLIKTAASAGEYSVTFYESIKTDVKLKFQQDGFKVNDFSDGRDGITVTVSWQ